MFRFNFATLETEIETDCFVSKIKIVVQLCKIETDLKGTSVAKNRNRNNYVSILLEFETD